MKNLIDSINFEVNNVFSLDFKHLRGMGIVAKQYQVPQKNGFIITGYHFKYKDIDFNFSPTNAKLKIKTTTHKVLKKTDITLNDLQKYMQILRQYVKEILDDDMFRLELERLDYYVDIELPDKIKMLYLNLYKYIDPNFGYMKIKKSYTTSVYRQSARGQFNLNLYSRFEHTGDERDRNILRLELQMKKRKIQNELKKCGISAEIENYWSSSSMEIYYFNFLERFFGIGTHRKLEDAKVIIDNSNYSDKYKKKLKKFLEEISLEIDYKKLKYYPTTTEKYKKMLGELDINPICISRVTGAVDSLPNLLTVAREIAEKKYFK